ncbi:hypothetical protein PP501_gp27 [Gordonia phage Powerball]|uniref:Uncharacterized protein n=1 Tax=Gordonia phage Powerball TaxID=2599847 RepID=A0A5J6TRQ7_9CAUD|nr:hypothetical protein PP501_gp27 [Gordonia phage Powerball]QFG13463.1 hypothetical protein PBI_POWERBALL_27 [Gordonia phage Powerball]
MVLPNTRYRTQRQWSAIAFLVQKMTKTTTQNFSGTMPVQFVGFGPDASTPDTVVVSDALQVTGSGMATIVVDLTGGTGNATLTIEVRVNGVSKTPTGSISTGTTSFTVPSVALSHGDLITLWCIARSGVQRNVTAASVTVVPL